MKNKTNTSPLLHALLPVVAVIVYVLLGYFFKGKGWSIGWIVFLLIPIIESLFTAIKTKNPGEFSYPLFVTAIFLTVGLIFHVWHPTWVVFVTIPAFYAICDSIKKTREQKTVNVDAQTMPNNIAAQSSQYPQYPTYPQGSQSKTNWVPVVVSIVISITAISIVGILCAFSFIKGNGGFAGFNFDYDFDETYTEVNGSANIDVSEINSIEIDWVNGNVNIEYYDGDTVFLEESGKSDKYPMGYKIEEGTLEIEEYTGNFKSSVVNGANKDLTVKIPFDFKATEFSVSVVSSNVVATNINATIFDFETVSGNGDFTFVAAPQKIESESVSGDVTITLPADVSGYSVSKESVSGTFNASDFDNALRFGDGSVIISADSVSGNITLKKAEHASTKI